MDAPITQTHYQKYKAGIDRATKKYMQKQRDKKQLLKQQQLEQDIINKYLQKQLEENKK